jgi:hypothetical protein
MRILFDDSGLRNITISWHQLHGYWNFDAAHGKIDTLQLLSKETDLEERALLHTPNTPWYTPKVPGELPVVDAATLLLPGRHLSVDIYGATLIQSPGRVCKVSVVESQIASHAAGDCQSYRSGATFIAKYVQVVSRESPSSRTLPVVTFEIFRSNAPLLRSQIDPSIILTGLVGQLTTAAHEPESSCAVAARTRAVYLQESSTEHREQNTVTTRECPICFLEVLRADKGFRLASCHEK